ncbi:MAG: hypothetical protein H7X85_09650 [Thermoanaerobaculia bacterium]|nr:hypothetical protein [Thermoanaerobaculia bacterium]
MRLRRVGLALAVSLLLLVGKAGCTRKGASGGGGRLTPTRGPGYTPLPRPPTPTFVPGLPTPPPELPG